MTPLEKKQITYLQKRKNDLIDQFIGQCNEINEQIKEIKNGEWIKEVDKKGAEQNDQHR